MATPSQPDRADAIGAAGQLTDALNNMSAQLADVKRDSEDRDKALTDYGRGNRHRIWFAYSFVAFDIVMTVVVVFFAVIAHSAASSADQNRQASATSCASGNDLRHTMVMVFNHIFSAFQPAPGETAAQKVTQAARIKAIEAYYQGKFVTRDCTAIYGVSPASPGSAATGSP